MNYYEIYSKETGELVARGNARECRDALGYASVDVFYKMISTILRGESSIYTAVKFKGGQTDYPVLGDEKR